MSQKRGLRVLGVRDPFAPSVRETSPLERLRGQHRPDECPRRCRICLELWPCDVALLIEVVDAVKLVMT